MAVVVTRIAAITGTATLPAAPPPDPAPDPAPGRGVTPPSPSRGASVWPELSSVAT